MNSRNIIYDKLTPKDAPCLADIFIKAFPDTVSIFYKDPASGGAHDALCDIFRFYVMNDPKGGYAARVDGKTVAGYILAPKNVNKLKYKFMFSRELFIALGKFMAGKYHLSFFSLMRVFFDKTAFVFHAKKTGPDIPARILSVAVLPEYQGKGIGKELTKLGIESLQTLGAKKIRLEVRENNAAAIAVYEKLGFETIGKYTDTRGAWMVMIFPSKFLPQSLLARANS